MLAYRPLAMLSALHLHALFLLLLSRPERRGLSAKPSGWTLLDNLLFRTTDSGPLLCFGPERDGHQERRLL
jgi:hypothetical protein